MIYIRDTDIQTYRDKHIFLYAYCFCFFPIVCQKAKRSYQKDIATFREARESNANALAQEDDSSTANGLFPN